MEQKRTQEIGRSKVLPGACLERDRETIQS